MFKTLCVLLLSIQLVLGDVYMHNPRGSNNRLNERSANRRNANRLFDSQNNNRGGYNAGHKEATGDFGDEDDIYYMQHFQSGPSAPSRLTIEWTNQHGCGGNEDSDPHKLNCNIVIQYMVSDVCDYASDDDCMRNGVNTNTQTFNEANNPLTMTQAQLDARKANQVASNRGLHETYDYYHDCYIRSRNRGLFTADQNLRTNRYGNSSAIYTRQNANGNRRGYECPEERDYYPYWHPTPWRDIAILADNASQCEWYVRESQNVQGRGICRELDSTGAVKTWSYWNNKDDCEIYGGHWFVQYAHIDIENVNQATCTQNNGTNGLMRMWAPTTFGGNPTCLVLPPAPQCQPASWSRVNHLGNGRDGVPLNYTWTLPYFPSGREKYVVVRLRYNISTDDYDPFNTNASYNQNLGRLIRSPVTQNPYINIGAPNNKPLRLAINTAQFGRTFQDRSHVMRLLPRSIIPHSERDTCTIHNLNVRGKRGNIVQTYPSVEYDFIPNRLQVSNSDCVHIQWTGSNTHNNGAPGGDGQTGDAGEGTGGTDRHNILQTSGPNSNYPLPWHNMTMWTGVELLWKDDSTWPNTTALSAVDVAVAFSSSGYYGCYASGTCTNSIQSGNQGSRLNELLNNARASFSGALVRFQRGVYHYICSRNNNFTNRSQKGVITVTRVHLLLDTLDI